MINWFNHSNCTDEALITQLYIFTYNVHVELTLRKISDEEHPSIQEEKIYFQIMIPNCADKQKCNSDINGEPWLLWMNYLSTKYMQDKNDD